MADGMLRWADGQSHDAASVNRTEAVLRPPAAGAFAVASGLRLGTGAPVSVGGSPETVTVAPHAGTIGTGAGPLDYALPSAVEQPLGVRPGSGTSRIDLVIVRAAFSGDVGATVERVAGTAAVSPQVPQVPEDAIWLARLAVPAAGAVTVSSNPARAVAAGGVLPVDSTAARDALPGAYAGMVVHNAQTGRLEVHDGTDWPAPPDAGNTGWTTITFANTLWDIPSGDPLRIREKSGWVEWRGQLRRAGSRLDAGVVAGISNVIPAAFRPSSRVVQRCPHMSHFASDFDVEVLPSGDLSVTLTGSSYTESGAAGISMSWMLG